MKILWLDDIRPIPKNITNHFESYKATTVDEAIDIFLDLNDGEEFCICFDHDLGTEKTGYDFAKWLNSNLSKNFPQKPNSEIGILAQSYNPLFIHQFCEKWHNGEGLSIYRHLAKYFIDVASAINTIGKIKFFFFIKK